MAGKNELHVVLGATGGLGLVVTRELVKQGKPARGVSRSRNVELPGPAESVAADISDPESARQACKGASAPLQGK
jgi:uncharacterized protein YbjT (DUF2867 family)